MKTTLDPKSVDAYIAKAPKEIRARLREIRALIKKTVPKARERISYQMPFYEYEGPVVYFSAANGYVGLYIPPPIVANHAEELKGYATTKSAVHLPLDKKLPLALIRKLIRARLRFNEGKKR